MWRALLPSLGSSGLMAATLQVLFMLTSGVPGVVALGLCVAAGAAQYVALLWVLDPEAVDLLIELGRGVLPGRKSVVS